MEMLKSVLFLNDFIYIFFYFFYFFYCRGHEREALKRGSILTKYVCTYVVGHAQECHAECHLLRTCILLRAIGIGHMCVTLSDMLNSGSGS